MVKVRLLLAGLFVSRVERSRLQPLLSELASQAAGNQDEWVRATAAVVGDYSGLLDMRALMTQFPLVRESIMRFSSQLEELTTPPSLLPQTEQYMHRDISRLPVPAAGASAAATSGSAGARPHFRLRETPLAGLGELVQGAGNSGVFGVQSGSGISAGGGSGGLLLLGSLGSVAAGSAASLGLDGKASVGPGPGPSGDSLVRRGMGPGASGEMFILRSRADVSHSKELKPGPPTPGGKSVAGPPGLPLRVNRSRSLVAPDQLPVPESPHASATPSTASAATAAAAFGAAAPAPPAATAAAAAGVVAAPAAALGGGAATGAGTAPAGPSGTVAHLPPLPPLQVQQLAGAAAAGGGAGGGGGAAVTRRDSLPSLQSTPRGSWQGGAAPTAAAQQYPLAAAIAFAAAAASGESLLSGPLSSFHASNAAGEVLSFIQQQQQPYQQQHQRDCQQDAQLPYGRRSSSQDPQGQGQDAGEEVYNDGFGAGDRRLAGRQLSGGFERTHSGGAIARRWSGVDSGGGLQGGGHGPHAGAGAEYHGRAGGPADDGEPDAKRPRAGE
ncbi:hypothetical protein PLESTB_000156600 [Pleodorina starrii]|uniref:Uncharacterized protein n=1 Tax=Pleodorina starrii TaxID=330485 RepID=A0A9W6BBY8_9CHLO|nr:hypothetical protein PLESTB_000156600 [Pleodorina starrii]